ncbi:unnamed protein product [Eruca vesicaria subsp. sativa]|uniref:Uncharacterized protein n=1 Tax=Eruca vesicaria subsp. sativa TaxID=29727 RepID=A0ABC8LEK3_ERUVS|nr:unnamed protein product [Eruca vesicaria subsp. sativa]
MIFLQPHLVLGLISQLIKSRFVYVVVTSIVLGLTKVVVVMYSSHTFAKVKRDFICLYFNELCHLSPDGGSW